MTRCPECQHEDLPVDAGDVWKCARCGFEWPKNANDVWDFALSAVEVALDTIPDPMARLEASAQMGMALHYARALAPAEGDPPVLRAVTTR